MSNIKASITMSYILPTPEAGKEFFLNYRGKGPITMLNLLKFKKVADYSEAEHLNPKEPISGEQAYNIYAKHVIPLLESAGGKIMFLGSAGSNVIGPESEKWDRVLLVTHKSAEAFTGFANDEDYQKIAGHRTAALDDSRLIPIIEFK